MKTYHITYFVSRVVESDTGVLLGGITVKANDILDAINKYRIEQANRIRKKMELLPNIEEIKYILEV